MPGSTESLSSQDQPAPMDRFLQETCLAYEKILAAFVFGSQATGAAGPGSDVDVAVLLEECRQD